MKLSLHVCKLFPAICISRFLNLFKSRYANSMTERRVRELAPGEEENPSLFPEDSNEDADSFFDAIANRNKIKDNDLQALPGIVDEDVLVDIADHSTALLAPKHSITADSIDTHGSVHEADDDPAVDIAAPDEDEDLDGPATEAPPQSPPAHSRPPASPRSRPPASPAPTRSPPSRPPASAQIPHTSAAPKAPADPVAAYAERRKREEMEKEREEAEKRELLTRFFEFEEAGIPCPKRFTLKSDIAEMRFEFKKLDDEFNRKQTIKMWKEGVKLVSNVIEVMNKRFDPIGWKASDFSDNLNLKLGEMDWALREVHKKYFRRGGKPSPEMYILFAIGSVAVDTHKSNTKKEEQRQQKAAQNQQANMQPPFFPHPPQGYPYPPPAWYGPPPPGYFNGPRPGGPPGPKMPPPQHQQRPPNAQFPPQQQRPPNAQFPPQQQPIQHQQQPVQQAPQQPSGRPTVVSGVGSVPGTNPLAQPQQRQMPDVSRVAQPVPAPMPEPINTTPPRQGGLRMIPPPQGGGFGAFEDMGQIMKGLTSSAAQEPPARRTSNYSSNPDDILAEPDNDNDADSPTSSSSVSEEPVAPPKTTPKRRAGPIEPPKSASPSGIRYVDGELVFE